MQKEGQNKKRWIERFKERRRSEGGERGNTVRKEEKEAQKKRKGNWISSNLFRAQQASSLSLSSYLLGYRLSSGLALFLNSFSPFFSSLSLSLPSFSLFRFSITFLRRVLLAKPDSPLRRNEGPRGFSLMTFPESHAEIFSCSIQKKFRPQGICFHLYH